VTHVLVDTSVWSLALRRTTPSADDEKLVLRLSEIIRDLRLVMIGPIRQEIFSGLSEERKHEDLRQRLSIFPDHAISTHEYELAARFHNDCRRNGIQGSHTDFLICAVAQNNGFRVLTVDKDFLRYQKHVSITLEGVEA
jgi:predicted nucleic acid-binding protein